MTLISGGYYAPILPNGLPGDASGFPYRTQTAELIWKKIQELIPKHPELSEKELVLLAVEETGSNPWDITPEDWRLLEMATEWKKNGFQGSSTGGASNKELKRILPF